MASCPRHSPIWLQTPHNGEPPSRSSIEPMPFRAQNRFRRNRNSEVKGAAEFQSKKSRRSHADNLRYMPIKRELLANYQRIAREFALPKSKANHSRRRSAALIIRAREESA